MLLDSGYGLWLVRRNGRERSLKRRLLRGFPEYPTESSLKSKIGAIDTQVVLGAEDSTQTDESEDDGCQFHIASELLAVV